MGTVPPLFLGGYRRITHGLGIYVLNLLIGFLSPKEDLELEVLDEASLPIKGSENLSLSFATSLNLDSGNLAFLIFISLLCYSNSFMECIHIFLETSYGVAFF